MASNKNGVAALIERLPKTITDRVEEMRKEYKRTQDAWHSGSEAAWAHSQTLRAKHHAYATALMDGGVITDYERKELQCYLNL